MSASDLPAATWSAYQASTESLTNHHVVWQTMPPQ